jgi:hypothetical protein
LLRLRKPDIIWLWIDYPVKISLLLGGNMKKLVKSLAVMALIIPALALIASYGGGLATTNVSAEGSDSTEVTVNVINSLSSIVIDVVNGQTYSGGTVETDNANVEVELEVSGEGLVTIADQAGTVLYSYNKTSATLERLKANFQLPDKPDSYQLTAKISGVDGTSSQTLTIIYKAAPFVPDIPLPLAPNSGYLSIGGYAISVIGLFIIGVVAAALAWLAWWLIIGRRRRQAKSKTA